MAVWIVRSLGEQPSQTPNEFSDVNSNVWWAPYVQRLAELGVTQGCATNPLRYCPNEPVTRAQMATFLVRAFDPEPAGGQPGFSDVSADHFHRDDIDTLALSRITAGCATGKYCPNNNTTRAQMASFLARATGLIPLPEPQTTHTSTDTPVSMSQVSVGEVHSCAIATDQTIKCWGWNQYGQSDPPEGEFIQVSAGGTHSYAIATNHTIKCWGDDGRGITDAPGGTYTRVVANNWFTCALATDGAIRCWGDNFHDQSSVPPGTYTHLAMSDTFHTCAIRTNKTVDCWGGDYSRNVLGNFYTDKELPLGAYTDMDTSHSYTCTIRTNQTLQCWDNVSAKPYDAPAGTFTHVTTGSRHMCAISTNQTIECWGFSGSYFVNREVYKVVLTEPPEGTYRYITTRRNHSCAIATDGTIDCWEGLTGGPFGNEYGQSEAPPGTYTQIATGIFHNCAIATNGTVRCWGRNDFGQSNAPSGSYG